MTLTFNGAQEQVHEWINHHPDGYFSNKKLIQKLEEEGKEIKDALIEHEKEPNEMTAKALKIEIGDELFAIICLANSKGINLDECFNLMMEKNRKRAQNNYQKEEQ